MCKMTNIVHLMAGAHFCSSLLSWQLLSQGRSGGHGEGCFANLGAVEGVCCDIEALQSFVIPEGCSAVLVQQAGQCSVRLYGLSEQVRLQGAAWRKGIGIPPAETST